MCGVVEWGGGRRKRALEEVSIPCRVGLCAEASPIIHLRLSSELAGHGAGQSAAAVSFHDSDAGHDMWSRTISCNEDSDNLPCVRLGRRPMGAASKIATRRAGRVVLALRWPAGTEDIWECSAGHARPGQPSPRSRAKWSRCGLGGLRLCWLQPMRRLDVSELERRALGPRVQRRCEVRSPVTCWWGDVR